jgi:chaperonin GroES
MKNKIRPRQNAVLVEKVEDEKHSSGGIKLVREMEGKPRIGIVVAVGPGVLDEEGKRMVTCGVKAGDKIAWHRTYEKTFRIDNEDYIFVKANGILGIVPDE